MVATKVMKDEQTKIELSKKLTLIKTHINSIRSLINKIEHDYIDTAKYPILFQKNIDYFIFRCRELENEIRSLKGNYTNK